MNTQDHQATDNSASGRTTDQRKRQRRPRRPSAQAAQAAQAAFASEPVPKRQTTPIAVVVARNSNPLADEDKAEILDLFLRFNETYSNNDVRGHLETYLFPTVHLAPGQVMSFAKPEDVPPHILTTGLTPDYWRSEWKRLDVVQANPDKVHVATVFSRQRKDGSEINRCPSLYILEKERGRWGIRAHSAFPS
jgi:hypothetical protein